MLEKEASSSLGMDRIKQLVPAYAFSTVNNLLLETSEAHEILRLYPQFTLRGFRNIKPFVKKAAIQVMLEPDNFLEISTTVRSGNLVKKFFAALEGSYPLIHNQVKRISHFNDLSKAIEKAITEDGAVAENATPKLRSICRSIADHKNKVKEKLQSMVHSAALQKKLQEQIVTIRNDRYVIPVKHEFASSVPGLIHDQSASGATVFIEPMAVVELNNRLKQLILEKQAEEEKVLMELTEKVADVSDELMELVEALTELDVYFAKAKLAYKLKASKPIIVEEKYIRLKKARHPLINAADVVPIDFWMSEETKMVVITGPNTGGKTVTLKTIGLLSLMAQSGLFIPADEESCLTVFDNIFVDIGDEQSLEQSLSTFSSHMTNIIEILNFASKKSLILLDELGAGTDPVEGAALARAILEHIYEIGAFAVATTHFGALKHFAYNTKGVENASVEFDDLSLQPTYKLLMGLPGRSNALEISRRLGLKDNIIENAKSFMNAEEVEVGDLIQRLEKNRKEIEMEKHRIVEERQEMEKLKESMKDKIEKFKQREHALLEKAAIEAKDLLKQFKKETKEILAALNSCREVQDIQKRIKGLDEKINAIRVKEPTYDGDVPNNIQPGDVVLIPKLNQKAIVLQPPDENGEVLVQAGIMKVSINIGELRADKNTGDKEQQKKSFTSIVSEKNQYISPEIDIRGCKAEEAVVTLDKYLDDATITGLNQVAIIHGKGTGALAKAVQAYLKSHPQVKEYRFGQQGEGSYGVTIVKL